MESYITPTYDPWKHIDVVLEWHEDCLRARFSPQEQPYHCEVCGGEVGDGAEVVYITLGDKPHPPYRRLERRGYQLPLIAHLDCWGDTSAPAISRQHSAAKADMSPPAARSQL